MADTVTSTDLLDSDRYYIVQLTNESDGTGEAAVKKVDVSAIEGAPSLVSIEEIWYSTQGMAVELHWDATADVLAWVLPADRMGHIDFGSFGAIKNNAGSGVTGDVMLTTIGAGAGDSYNVVLICKKNA